MLNYFLKLINCNKRRTTQGGGVAAPVAGKIFAEVLDYLELPNSNDIEVEEVYVPDLIGLPIKEAQKILEEQGLEIKYPEDLDAEKIVTKQIPEKNVIVKEKTKILIYAE